MISCQSYSKIDRLLRTVNIPIKRVFSNVKNSENMPMSIIRQTNRRKLNKLIYFVAKVSKNDNFKINEPM